VCGNIGSFFMLGVLKVKISEAIRLLRQAGHDPSMIEADWQEVLDNVRTHPDRAVTAWGRVRQALLDAQNACAVLE
jgi:hypothetical protein